MDWTISILTVLAGAIGGTVAGRLFYKISLGRYMNSIVGALTALILMLSKVTLVGFSDMDIKVSVLISGVIIGFVAMPIAGLIKKSLKK